MVSDVSGGAPGGQESDLGWLLRGLVEQVPHTRSAVLLSSDGLATASYGLGADPADQLSAIASGLFSLARTAAVRFGGSDGVRQVVAELDDTLLFVSGVVTAVPLLCFGAASQRLRLSTLGFMQYLAPSIQFLLAVSLLGEPFRRQQQITFGCTWAALAVFTAESVLARRRAAPPGRPAAPAPRCQAARTGAACPPSR